MPEPSIAHAEFARRRKKLRTTLRKSVGVVFAGDLEDHLNDTFRPHPHLEYLAGVVDEPGAVLMLDPGHPVEARRELLFLRPLNPEIEKWDGYRLEVSAALRERTGFKSVFRTTHLPRFLTEAVARTKSVACLHPFANYEQDVSRDLALFRRLAERIPGLDIGDQTTAIPAQRAVKSKAEVDMIQRAIDITAAGFDAVMTSIAPGQNEFEVQETLEHAYRTHGSRGPAFGTIVGSGVNGTVLHYRANDQTIEDGDLVCIDSGASYRGYGADVTRTLPANGRFTDRQREVYEVVLKALVAATRAVKPGVTLADLDRVARAIITKAGYGDYFIHSIGHHLGLETHDAAPPQAPLKQGAIVTIEPGIYIPDEKIGIRIEDDVVVTKDGHRVLTSKIPRTIKDIEARMQR